MISSKYNWSEIETDTILSPIELTAYYIYKQKCDELNKKDTLKNEDVSYLKEYYERIGGGIGVSKDNFGK